MEKNNMRHEAWISLRDGEFQEDDVWNVLDGFQSSYHATKPSFSTQSLLPSEPRMIPERQNRGAMAPMRQHSVPHVNVPNWSMVHRKKSKIVDDDDDNDHDDYDDDEEEEVSPEEYFLRRSQSSSSVMEGVGRKLKGRDLSRVRNTVWKKTGFLE